MQILQVDLENVKSYGYASVTFGLGTNAICGHNGAGKSTVLEAIGFALFDYLAVSQADFVREGEKTATVTVHVAGRDGRAYQVVRRCGSNSQHYVYDPELDQKLAEGKQETIAWLNELMGVEGGGELDVLFRDAVGVPQGLLTAAFLDTPSRRKDTFNPLLRVDEYERVWEGLREPARHLERQIADQQTRIAGLEAQVTALPDLRERAAYLDAEIAAGEAQERELDASQADVAADLAVLTERKERIEALDQAIGQAQAVRQSIEVRLETTQAAVMAAEAAQAVVQATEAGHEAYLTAQQQQASLEAARQTRDAGLADRRQTAQALAVVEERADRLHTELDAVAYAKATMARLEPDVAQQVRLTSELQRAQRDVDRLERAEGELDRETARLADLQERHTEARDQAARREQREAALAEAREGLATQVAQREAVAAELAEVEVTKAQIEAQITASADRLKAAERRVDQGQDRLDQIAAQLATVHAQLAELSDVAASIEETQKTIRARAADRQAAVETAAAREAALSQARRQLEMLSTAETPQCPVCGAPLTDEHRADLIAETGARVQDLLAEKAEAEQDVRSAAAAVTEQETALAKLEARARTLPRPEEADLLETQRAGQHRILTEDLAAASAERDELLRQQPVRDDLAAQLEAVQGELAGITQEIEARRAVVRSLEEELQTLARPDEVDTLATTIEEQEAIVAEIETTVTVLSAAPDRVTALSEELATLGDPQRIYDRAADAAAREDAIAEQLATAETEIEGLQTRLAEIDTALEAYAALDDDISAARQALSRHEEAHQRYLQHVREAGTLEARRATVAELTAARAEAETAYAEQVAARAEIAADYDPGLHTKLSDELSEIRATLAAVAERLRQYRMQLDEATTAIAKLEAVEASLVSAQSELTGLQETLALLSYLRQVLREAGPQITRALVQMISLHADRLYADIMQTYRSRLRWTEDYEIVLSTEGRERTFQQLSGGEQMAAGLAVRLALLREISTVDVAFFDEPTANLDAERRANLAQQILNIKGFSQLFVISHDDTFEQDTDHVIRVRKVDGASVVEGGE